MYNSIVKAVRKTISADKQRFENESYDLDLTYICERVIAMSFPADGVESAYRNSVHEVSQMLNEHHKGHYKIFNLSERQYDYTLFDGNVFDWCGFPDHNAPPLSLLFKIVVRMYKWLEADSNNVVIVHCLAGKGRTGTVIACLLLYCGLFDNAEDAMRYFAVKRSSNNYGITGPSQIRYVHYFSDIYIGNQELNNKSLFLRSITMHTIPKFFLGPLKQGVCPVLNIYSATQKGLRIFSSAPMDGDSKETRTYLAGNATLVFEVRKIVRGDILVVFSHITPFYRVEQIARFNFHTGMFQMPTLIMRKTELDEADGDKRFANDFYFKLDFEEAMNPLTVQQNLMYQEEIKSEIKWIKHEGKKVPRNGSTLFFPKNTSEKIKAAKDIASKQGLTGVHSGFLFKKGHNFKNWRRRWFVLKENILSYYKSPKDTAPAGTIPIAEIEHILIGDETSAREGYVHCFQLITTKSVYFIAAENERELEDWTETLKSAKKLIQESGRLFIEILEVRYSIDPTIMLSPNTLDYQNNNNNNNNNNNGEILDPLRQQQLIQQQQSSIYDEIDMITFLTITMGKKRDVTSFESVKFNPRFQYAGDFIVYDHPNDLYIGLWFRSSVLDVKDTLVAELCIPHASLPQSSFQTEFKSFNRLYANFLKDLQIKIGMSFKSTEDLNAFENKNQNNGQWQSTPNDNSNRKDFHIGKARTNTNETITHYNHTTVGENNSPPLTNLSNSMTTTIPPSTTIILGANKVYGFNTQDKEQQQQKIEQPSPSSPTLTQDDSCAFLDELDKQLDKCDQEFLTNEIMEEFEKNVLCSDNYKEIDETNDK